jgi:hypothetical protein
MKLRHQAPRGSRIKGRGYHSFAPTDNRWHWVGLTLDFDGISLRAAIRKIRKLNPRVGVKYIIQANPSWSKGGKSRAQKMINFDYIYTHK